MVQTEVVVYMAQTTRDTEYKCSLPV